MGGGEGGGGDESSRKQVVVRDAMLLGGGASTTGQSHSEVNFNWSGKQSLRRGGSKNRRDGEVGKGGAGALRGI